MAVHKATGTLLVACFRGGDVRLLDIRPSPSEWKLVDNDNDRVRTPPPLSLALLIHFLFFE
jgi:hypothetical protein